MLMNDMSILSNWCSKCIVINPSLLNLKSVEYITMQRNISLSSWWLQLTQSTIATMTGNYISTKLKCLKEEMTQYLIETTMHGFRYLVYSRNNVERMIWWVLICITVIASTVMVIDNCAYSIRNPIITTIETTVVQKVRMQ